MSGEPQMSINEQQQQQTSRGREGWGVTAVIKQANDAQVP